MWINAPIVPVISSIARRPNEVMPVAIAVFVSISDAISIIFLYMV